MKQCGPEEAVLLLMGEYLGTLFNKKNQPKGGMKRITFYIRNIVHCKFTSIRSK